MIGKVIQEKRSKVGLTQAQLAERLGVTAPAVNRWEKDMSYPDASLLAPLARLLKTDLNELFSFYCELSDKERKLIVDRISNMLAADEEAAMAFIESTLRQNPSDGLLYEEIADRLFGFHTLRKTTDPAIYLDKIVEYYERALDLLPEKEESISYSLVMIYSELGNADKAEEAWSRLKETKVDKTWVHAEMLYTLKNYRAAVSELKEALLRQIIHLSTGLDLLRDALYLNGEQEQSACANDSSVKLRQLFGIWDGFDFTSNISHSVAASDAENESEQIRRLIECDAKDQTISGSPLFADVVLGNKSMEDSTPADCMADIMRILQSKGLDNK